MADGGVLSRDKLHVVEDHDSTTVTTKTPTKETPQWEAITVTVSKHVEAIKFTPVDKNGKPVGDAQIHHVTDSHKPVVIPLPGSVKAEGYVLHPISSTSSKHTIHVLSAVACVADEGNSKA